jgi:hypothetical protein
MAISTPLFLPALCRHGLVVPLDSRQAQKALFLPFQLSQASTQLDYSPLCSFYTFNTHLLSLCVFVCLSLSLSFLFLFFAVL